MQEMQTCLSDLQALQDCDDDASRKQLLERVTDLFFLTSGNQGDTERKVFGDAMERLAYQLEVAARSKLAERLSSTVDAPHELIVKLANDEINVAKPVLENSPALKEDDLVAIAESKGQDHLHALTRRPKLSRNVTDVIVDRGNDTVLTSIAGNKGAQLSTRGIEKLSLRASESSGLYTALEQRPDIPDTMLKEIKRNIAVRLWTEAVAVSSDISGKEIDDIVDEKVAELELSQPRQISKVSRNRKNGKAVTEQMVLSFARSRMITETIQSLSLMSGISISRISHCLMEAELSALAVLCKAYKFKNTTYAAIMQLRAGTKPLHVRVIADAMRHYDQLDTKTAKNALDAVRKRSEREENARK